MAVQIDEMKTELEVKPVEPRGSRSASTASGSSAADPVMLERLRPLVLQIIQEELERIRRQQG